MALKSISNILLPFLLKQEWGKEVLCTSEKQKKNIHSASGSSANLLVATAFLTERKSALYVLSSQQEALYAAKELEQILGKEQVLFFPSCYTNPYQFEKTENANIVLRTEVLERLTHAKNEVVVVSFFDALVEKIIAKEDYKALTHLIKVGDQLDFGFLEELLQHFHFQKVDFVSQPGEFSVRGGIVDVFSFSNDQAYRLVFFGNEIESIKTFDLETQRSLAEISGFQLVSNIERNTESKRLSLCDLFEPNSLLFTKNEEQCLKSLQNYFEKAQKKFDEIQSSFNYSPAQNLYLSAEEFFASTQRHHHFDFPFHFSENQNNIRLNITEQPSFSKNFELLIQDLEEKAQQGYLVYISFSNEKQKERLESILQDLGKNNLFKSFESEMHEGFIDHDSLFAVYTDHQIFERFHRSHQKNRFAKSEQLTLKELMSLKVGDFIAHVDHGIGKFMGLVNVNNNGKIQECFKLSYQNNDLLYVSVHALHKISKYSGPEGKIINLSKLGSPAWKALKQKTKAKVKQIAFDLIKLYAKRKSAKGFAFTPDGYMQNELEASFIYEDTPDQEKSTIDVKADMESDLVMDRLICGDVGFGKTEIAIRAAFKAATDGKQVVVLVPTTILAFQHYRSFKERLKDFPVEISFLNRFRSAKQKKLTLEGLENGKIDIVIGTHQLVSASVKFKDLGLLIIDEEHKFGVNVKEKLKNLKTNIDTLTLTATPIPRTLQFSLMAARDLSVIKTPPPNRQAVETHIVGFEEELIRDAVSEEIQRGGQCYFINNRIENLKDIAGIIQRLVPDARVITGHGQMDGKQLEENMLEFMEGNYDVLVSTTIVESGLDVPNANTIFINDAQRFGMADLHQMRGRVGRSNRKAYCYLITPPFDFVSSLSKKRLEAIEQFSDLGSGFQIAMKDLEIRGAGDLLGAEQSGFISEIGFETYQKIIQEAIEELQDEDLTDLALPDEDRKKIFHNKREVTIDTDLELMLPNDYVQSSEERLLLYQNLAVLTDKAELKDYELALIDRFGQLPKEAQNLLRIVELKWSGEDLGFEKIVLKNGIFLGYFIKNQKDRFYQTDSFGKIMTYIHQFAADVQIKELKTNQTNHLVMRKEGISDVEDLSILFQKMKNHLHNF